MPPSTDPAGTGPVVAGSVRTEIKSGSAALGQRQGAPGRAEPGLVLTRRGRLAILTLVVLTVIGLVIAAQGLSFGSAPEKTLVRAADGSGPEQLGSSTGQDAQPLTEDPLTTPTTPSTDDPGLQLLPLLQQPTESPTAEADAPVIINGRAQPAPVEVPTAASGELAVVPGTTEPVTGEHVWTYRVEVEQGLPFDGEEFAAAVHATLSDPRGWAQDGNVFQQVDGDAVDFRLVLASPHLTDRLCAPLQTRGQVSCRNGDLVVLNALRWGTGIDDYAGDVASYREYMVNHEVGHRLGRSHALCPGAGDPAPVMMQQTYGLEGCTTNSWPLPGE